MQLKRIQILGFKTFADKTEFEFNAGMTAIVGPNGSGKSNIVDALLWVLGEQNPRLLRGGSAQDVIFAGTDKRKPLGMAEVKLTVDNSDGTLPVKFAEVTITRRLYRSGESQYLLNNSSCRLKDIVELFLDTGVGKGAYAFVSQQEIDAVLSARPEDRRELFEEAAGIKKYRVKKREAMRKLETANDNLARVGDIIAEIETQRGVLEPQAIVARRCQLLQDRLQEIEIGLLVSELQAADRELRVGAADRQAHQDTLMALDTETVRQERAAAEIAGRLEAAEAQLDSARAANQLRLTGIERTESRLALLADRIRSAATTRQTVSQDLIAIEERVRSVEERIISGERDLAATGAQEEGKRSELTERRSALARLEDQVREALRRAEERQSERARLELERAARGAALLAVRDRIIDLDSRSGAATEGAAVLSGALEDARLRAEAARSTRTRVLTEAESLAATRAGLESERQRCLAEESRQRAALDGSRRALAEQSSRLATLSELQKNHEGFYEGVRAVLSARDRGELSGHYRAVVDLMTVPPEYRVAVEVALGGSLQDIVTNTEGEAKDAIEWLKRGRAGRATFLALPLLRPGGRLEPPRLDQAAETTSKNASDLVSCDPNYSPVLQLLLGRVLVVQQMDAAIALARRTSGWSKIVTLSGELMLPSGALSGGSLHGRGAHLVGRKGELDDLKREVPRLTDEVERHSLLLADLHTELKRLDAGHAEAARRESVVASEAASAEAALAGIDREIARLERDCRERVGTAKQLGATAAALRADAARMEREAKAGSAETHDIEDAFVALSDQARALASERDTCRAGAVALEVAISRLVEKREGLSRALNADRNALKDLLRQREAKVGQRSGAECSAEDAEAESERLQGELTAWRLDLAETEAAYQAAAAERSALVEQNGSIAAASRECSQRRAAVVKVLHESELRLARLDIQASQAAERLFETYSLSREDALARPPDDTIDRSTILEVGRLRREIRGLGSVNLGAIAEYERLSERSEFLTRQRADLETGRTALLKTIDEIDENTLGVFHETLETVRVEFDRIFRRLFDGGSTKLVVTAPEDLLESGIEVIVQPPGKRPQSLSLLSGGERALTAAALMFAFLAVRPSPFVLLDEVDAPLDGVNVERFTRLVRDFSERSQFLLITHNPSTMEAAPNWYGITMREPGVSSVLSYRVPAESVSSDVSRTTPTSNKAGEPTYAVVSMSEPSRVSNAPR